MAANLFHGWHFPRIYGRANRVKMATHHLIECDEVYNAGNGLQGHKTSRYFLNPDFSLGSSSSHGFAPHVQPCRFKAIQCLNNKSILLSVEKDTVAGVTDAILRQLVSPVSSQCDSDDCLNALLCNDGYFKNFCQRHCENQKIQLYDFFLRRTKSLVFMGLIEWWQECHQDRGVIYAMDNDSILIRSLQDTDNSDLKSLAEHYLERYFGSLIFDEFFSFDLQKRDEAIVLDDGITIMVQGTGLAQTPQTPQFSQCTQASQVSNSSKSSQSSQSSQSHSNLFKFVNFDIDEENTMWITNTTPITPDNDMANIFDVEMMHWFEAKGMGQVPHIHLVARVCGQFLRFVEKECTSQVNGEEKTTVLTKHQRLIILGLFYIYNNYGLLSDNNRDVFHAHPHKEELFYPISLDGLAIEDTLVFRTGEQYMKVVHRFLSICPFQAILQPRFNVAAYEPIICKETFKEYIFGMGLIAYAFPRMPEVIHTAYAFLDGILYMGKQTFKSLNEPKKPVLEFYPWDQAQKVLNHEFCFLERQFYNVPIQVWYESINAISIFDQSYVGNHWLQAFVLHHLEFEDIAMVQGIYFITTILLPQLKEDLDTEDGPFKMFHIHDVNGWSSITNQEWECIEYLIACCGWLLGVVCEFPVILWIQGAPGTGKSTILETLIESTVSHCFKIIPSDRSKHMLHILNRTADGGVVADDVAIIDDLQTPLPKEVVAKLCSITDNGNKGSLSCEPKGQPIMSLDKWKMGNRNVRAAVASNIPLKRAIGALENETGIYRRSFCFTFHNRINQDLVPVNPKIILDSQTNKGAIITLCCIVGFKYSLKYKQVRPRAPPLLEKITHDYEFDEFGDFRCTVSTFVRQTYQEVEENVVVPRFKIKKSFDDWANRKDFKFSKRELENLMTVFSSVQTELFVNSNQFERLWYCWKCFRVLQYTVDNVSLKKGAAIKAYIQSANICCLDQPSQSCEPTRGRCVYTHLRELYSEA